jgi:outer membrane protein assembly factor BamB
VPEAFFGVGSSPVLEGDLLLVMVGGQPNSGMVAFNAFNGKTVWESVGQKNWEGAPMLDWPGDRKVEWKSSDKQASYATPVLTTLNGRRVALCLMRQGLVGLDPKSGEVLFQRWFRARVDESVNAANPVVVGSQILFSSAYYRSGAVLIDLKESNKTFQEIWKSLALEIHWTTPVVHNGYVYAFSGRNEPDARFRCVEFKSGKIMWDRDESWRKTTDQPSVYGRGSAILADEKLFILGEGGLLGMFKLNPNKPEEICRFQPPQLHYPCWAGPVLANGLLYLRSENRLLCFDVNLGSVQK